MKRIRKIAGKSIALVVALCTLMALLEPFEAKAISPVCGFHQTSVACGREAAAGVAAWWDRNFGGGANGGWVTLYNQTCDKGDARSCEYRADCVGGESKIVVCQPNCTVGVI